MNFNKHSDLEGKHAFLSPSSYHWINYDKDKLEKSYISMMAKERGTELHKLASDCIRLMQPLPKSQKTINMYVNDAIGYKMTPEQILCYSNNCYGTADAIGFRKNILRVHDLKTGAIPASMHQLEIYAALFFLEYHMKPSDCQIELRIYQNNAIEVLTPLPDDISMIMEKIVDFDKIIQNLRLEV